MRIACPNGYKETLTVGKVRIAFVEVAVCGGVCDSADLCKIERCEFYDVTRDGTRRFMRAAAEEESLEGFAMKLLRTR